MTYRWLEERQREQAEAARRRLPWYRRLWGYLCGA